MRIKKYVADTMPEALKLVKADLGPRAVILNTRPLKKSSALGILGKGQVEVTAAVDTGKTSASKPAKSRPRKKTLPEERPTPASSKPSATGQKKEKQTSVPAPSNADWANRISQQIRGLEAALQTSARSQDLVLPGALGPLSQQMEEAGLERELAEDLLKQVLLDPGEAGLKNLAPLQNLSARLLAAQCRTATPTRLSQNVRTVVALVGPAGMGKTTAAARIAAHFADHAQAVFIAADTDRVGGLEQLRAYAGILQIPVDIVQTPEEMGDVVRKRKDVNLVIIDTAGIGPAATDAFDHLDDLLREAAPSEIHLVLSASTGLQQMCDTERAYARIGVDRLLLTKLDETDRLGAVCTMAARTELPLSYITNGREVPGNLHPADPETLCRSLFTRRPHAAE